MIFDVEQVLAVGFVAAAVGYLLFVNRPVQTYRGRFRIDAPVEAVWDLLLLREGPFSWGGDVHGTCRFDEASKEDVLQFEAGYAIRSRVTRSEPPHRMDSTYRYDPVGPRGAIDIVHSQVLLTPVPGGTEVAVTYVVERSDFPRGWRARLLNPFKVASLAHVLRHELARRRSDGDVAPAVRKAASAGTWIERLAPTRMQAVLALFTLGWLALALGPETALVFWITILVHEYGHVVAMRRHGAAIATFYFVPLFGGVAIGGRMRTEAASVEVTLMGPAFGLLPGLALALVAVAGREGWLDMTSETIGAATMMAMLSIFLNGLNLLPVVPLDGGHVVQAMMRPIAGRGWLFVSGMVLLVTFVVTASSWTLALVVAFAVLALLWTQAVRTKDELAPLSRAGVLATGACYVALLAAHLAVVGAMFVTPRGPIGAMMFLENFLFAWKLALFGP